MRGTSTHGVFLLQLIFVFIFAIGNAAGQLKFTNPSLDGLTAGAPFNLTWTGASGTTTLLCKTVPLAIEIPWIRCL